MYIRKIDIINFKSFENETIMPFCKGLTVITGANGSGKSNLLDALKFVLLENGRLSQKQKESLLHTSKTACSVEVLFDDDGKEIILKRTMKKHKNGKFTTAYFENSFPVSAEKYRNIIKTHNLDKIFDENGANFKNNIKTSDIYTADNIFCRLNQNKAAEAGDFLKEQAKDKQIIVVSMDDKIIDKADSIITFPTEQKIYKFKSMTFTKDGNMWTYADGSLL